MARRGEAWLGRAGQGKVKKYGNETIDARNATSNKTTINSTNRYSHNANSNIPHHRNKSIADA
jgi:hypothetical protein